MKINSREMFSNKSTQVRFEHATHMYNKMFAILSNHLASRPTMVIVCKLLYNHLDDFMVSNPLTQINNQQVCVSHFGDTFIPNLKISPIFWVRMVEGIIIRLFLQWISVKCFGWLAIVITKFVSLISFDSHYISKICCNKSLL